MRLGLDWIRGSTMHVIALIETIINSAANQAFVSVHFCVTSEHGLTRDPPNCWQQISENSGAGGSNCRGWCCGLCSFLALWPDNPPSHTQRNARSSYRCSQPPVPWLDVSATRSTVLRSTVELLIYRDTASNRSPVSPAPRGLTVVSGANIPCMPPMLPLCSGISLLS